MADQAITITDYGGCDQAAVGMGAVENAIESVIPGVSLSSSDAGAGADLIAQLLAVLASADSGSGTDAASVFNPVASQDAGAGTDALQLAIAISGADAGRGIDAGQVLASVGLSDAGAGVDLSSKFSIYFYVDPSGVLNPLGVIVLRDSRHEVLPRTREYAEEIPGRHGEIDFGAEFEPHVLELHCATPNFSPEQRGEIKRKLAKYLNPLVGEVNLVFWDEPDREYWVRYSGQAEFARHYANWLEFTIPFKGRPFLVRMWEKRHVGSGELENEGTADIPLVIEIKGPVTNPQVAVGSAVLSYTGALTSADTLVIDTENMTVTFNGQNAIANYSGTFPWLPPGKTQVVAASGGTTTFRWRDRWL